MLGKELVDSIVEQIGLLREMIRVDTKRLEATEEIARIVVNRKNLFSKSAGISETNPFRIDDYDRGEIFDEAKKNKLTKELVRAELDYQYYTNSVYRLERILEKSKEVISIGELIFNKNMGDVPMPAARAAVLQRLLDDFLKTEKQRDHIDQEQCEADEIRNAYKETLPSILAVIEELEEYLLDVKVETVENHSQLYDIKLVFKKENIGYAAFGHKELIITFYKSEFGITDRRTWRRFPIVEKDSLPQLLIDSFLYIHKTP